LFIVNIVGGLGNQMFQYAVGRVLSEKYGVSLYLDTRAFKNNNIHNGFELMRIFNISALVASDTDIMNMIGWRATKIGQRLIRKKKLNFLDGDCYFREREISFNKDIFSISSNCYISGYWQSELYFNGYEKLIRNDFKFSLSLTDENDELSRKIIDCNAVSLHFRRGDYISNKHTASVHGTCSPSYYKKAVAHINEKLDDPVYFIFSDDIEWVKDNFSINNECYFVENNDGKDSYVDMHLMSLCSHHIIANSSFSWWGAWLNPSKTKIVIAPNIWFANGSNSNDNVPKSWVRL
jgi:hypothetical protein